MHGIPDCKRTSFELAAPAFSPVGRELPHKRSADPAHCDAKRQGREIGQPSLEVRFEDSPFADKLKILRPSPKGERTPATHKDAVVSGDGRRPQTPDTPLLGHVCGLLTGGFRRQRGNVDHVAQDPQRLVRPGMNSEQHRVPRRRRGQQTVRTRNCLARVFE